MTMLQKLGSKLKIVIAAIAIGAISLTSITSVYAAQTKHTYLLDNCDLKAEGWAGARTIERMYKNDKIVFYPDKFGSDTEYNYMKRNKTSHYGYVDHNYVMY